MDELCGVCRYPMNMCKCEHYRSEDFDRLVGDLEAPDESIKQSKGKVPLGNLLAFPHALNQVSKVREFGNTKYPDKESYKQIPTEYLLDATMRHLFKTGLDEETKVHHYASAIMNLLMILEKDKL